MQNRLTPAMRALAALPIALALLAAACSQNEHGKKVIAEQCIAEGETVEVCECLAKASADKLDPELFDMVVLGAQGEDAETAARMEELPPELQMKFAVVVPDILRGCGAEGYLAGS